jgi:hypothetical protein
MRAGWPGCSELLGGRLERPLLGILIPDLLDVEEAADAESVVPVDGAVGLVTSDVSDAL